MKLINRFLKTGVLTFLKQFSAFTGSVTSTRAKIDSFILPVYCWKFLSNMLCNARKRTHKQTICVYSGYDIHQAVLDLRISLVLIASGLVEQGAVSLSLYAAVRRTDWIGKKDAWGDTSKLSLLITGAGMWGNVVQLNRHRAGYNCVA